MKYLLVAGALFAAVFLFATQDKISISGGSGGFRTLGDSWPSQNSPGPSPSPEQGDMESQIAAIAQHLDTNPLIYAGLIMNALESCVPEDTPFYIVATLGKYVRITSENTLLPDNQQEADLKEKMAQLKTELETWLATLTEVERQSAVERYEELIGAPAVLFNCNAKWLANAER